MTSIYDLQPPNRAASPPPFWSYSSLREWKTCPRRWFLQRSRFPNIGLPFYPGRFSGAALVGIIVHQLVEKYDKYRGQNFAPRKEAVDSLRKVLSKIQSNPRVDVAALARRFDYHKCISHFRTFLSEFQRLPSEVANHTHQTLSGSELAFRLDRPRITGRIDRVRRGLLMDWKSGEESEEHHEQTLFYALGYWLTTGHQLLELAIFYTRTGVLRSTKAPDRETLNRLRDELCEEIATADQQISCAAAEARPSIENCRYCPVRQLCDEYWDSNATEMLRAIPAETHQTALADIQLEIKSREVGLHAVAFNGTVNSTLVKAVIPMTYFVGRDVKATSWLRLIQARIMSTKDGATATPVYGSEVFSASEAISSLWPMETQSRD